jgi:hypothetical protein
MKRIFELNPLEFPRRRGERRVIAFLTDERAILKVADSLGIPRSQAPPKILAPRDEEFFDELPPDEFS